MNYPSIRIEGTILSAELLDKLNSSDSLGQRPADFGFESQSKLKEEIVRAWAAAQVFYSAFQHKLVSIKEGAPATTETRNQWVIPLLGLLGYSELEFQAQAELVGDKPFRLSHRLHSHGDFVVHIVGTGESLDKKPTVGARVSPHALLQEYLNLTEHLYGIVTNGRLFRLLRDSTRLIKLSYVEFDLDRIFAEELFSDFAVLYRLLHVTRLPKTPEKSGESFLECYHQNALESGARIREGLSIAVEQVLQELGSGFLAQNEILQNAIANNTLVARDLHQGLLRLIYRLLLLMVAEERGLLFADTATQRQRKLYLNHYSIARLRRLAERRAFVDSSKYDLWCGLRSTFRLFETEGPGGPLGLTGLGGQLLSASALGPLQSAELDNGTLLSAIAKLSLFRQPHTRQLSRVNYGALATEEFGSVYERLLELHPVINPGVGNLPPTFGFKHTAGNERKTSGSYYTPSSLVECLLDSALDPVLQDRLENFIKLGYKSADEAVLGLKVCDPACGSGHFLIAAAQRIARRLALLRSKGDEPSISELRHVLREVISHCLYGVDLNPMSVELCKVALWLEAMEAGKPLSFLDHHIRCGNSLLGARPDVISKGIPDEAFNPIEGDDKKACTVLKKLNLRERAGFGELFALEDRATFERLQKAAVAVENLPDDSVYAVEQKSAAFEQFQHNDDLTRASDLANLWCAAFVIQKRLVSKSLSADDGFQQVEKTIAETGGPSEQIGLFGESFSERSAKEKRTVETNTSCTEAVGITTANLRNFANGMPLPAALMKEVRNLERQYSFFHWHLAFPEVFREDGFDVILGNPPWERVKLQEKEWFAERRPEIASVRQATVRKKIIESLKVQASALYAEFQDAVRQANCESHMIRNTGLYPLCGRGDINLYAVFAEKMRSMLGPYGQMGAVLPSGIATDDTTKHFFQDMVERRSLVSLFDFENRAALFPAVDSRMKFCLLTTSSGVFPTSIDTEFLFFAHRPEDLLDKDRRFKLSPEDIKLLNPNTRTCPIFRSGRDAELTKSIYRRVPIFRRETPLIDDNPLEWDSKLFTMLHSSSAAHLFLEAAALPSQAFLNNNLLKAGNSKYLPLYEGKMFHQFDHRFAGVVMTNNLARPAQPFEAMPEQKQNPDWLPSPRAWVASEEIAAHCPDGIHTDWFLGYKDVGSATNERTLIATILPHVAITDSVNLVGLISSTAKDVVCVLSNFNSFVFDYTVRQKVGGLHIKFYLLNQIPVLPPTVYAKNCPWLKQAITLKDWLLPRALELTYTSWDLETFAQDCGYFGPPFRWQEERRFQLRCEIDAAFFHLYDLRRDDTAYILDTFPIIKRKDEDKFGSYRTKDQILRVYDQLANAMSTSQYYQSSISPIAASFRVTHPPRLPLVQRIPLDSSEKFLLSFIFVFLKQTHEEATFQLLDSVFHLLRQRVQHADEFASILGESSKAWLSSYNDNVPNSDFLPFLKRLEADGWIIADRNSGQLRITEKFPAVPFDAWRNYDVSAALCVIAQQPDVVQLVLDQPDTPLASREFVLQKTA